MKILKEYPRTVFYLGKFCFRQGEAVLPRPAKRYGLRPAAPAGGMQTVVLPIRITLG